MRGQAARRTCPRGKASCLRCKAKHAGRSRSIGIAPALPVPERYGGLPFPAWSVSFAQNTSLAGQLHNHPSSVSRVGESKLWWAEGLQALSEIPAVAISRWKCPEIEPRERKTAEIEGWIQLEHQGTVQAAWNFLRTREKIADW